MNNHKLFYLFMTLNIIMILILIFLIFNLNSQKRLHNKELFNNHTILRCITVSVNYSKELNIIIPKNIDFFDTWIIVTSKEDNETISILNNYNKIYNNKIKILYFDFKKNGSTFNKGGGIKYAQEYINNNLYNQNQLILILDSDIILPSEFNKFIEKTNIDSDTLICSKQRIIYKNIDDYKNSKKVKITHDRRAEIFLDKRDINNKILKCIGYFQLYKQSNNKFYKNSYSSAKCDLEFVYNFKKIRYYNDLVTHLGPISTYWNGR